MAAAGWSAVPLALPVRPSGALIVTSNGFGRSPLVARRTKEAAQVDHGVGVDVLVLGDVEEASCRSDADLDLVVTVWLDRADRFEQRNDGVPLNVVARGVLENLVQGVAVVAAEVGGRIIRGHAANDRAVPAAWLRDSPALALVAPVHPRLEQLNLLGRPGLRAALGRRHGAVGDSLVDSVCGRGLAHGCVVIQRESKARSEERRVG